MNWNEMTPEEKDRLVAEKIMGWQRFQDCDATEEDILSAGEYRYCLRCGTSEYQLTIDHSQESPPRYTQSMDAAWRLILHLDLHLVGFEYAFYKRSDRYGDNVWLWECRFDYLGKRFSSAAQQPAEAICLAVLKAVGIEHLD